MFNYKAFSEHHQPVECINKMLEADQESHFILSSDIYTTDIFSLMSQYFTIN